MAVVGLFFESKMNKKAHEYICLEFISDALRSHHIKKVLGGLQRPPYPQLDYQAPGWVQELY